MSSHLHSSNNTSVDAPFMTLQKEEKMVRNLSKREGYGQVQDNKVISPSGQSQERDSTHAHVHAHNLTQIRGHNHHHHHQHAHTPPNISTGKLLGVTLLNGSVTIVELVGGLFSGSLSLLSDAVHNLGDTLSLLFAYIAKHISTHRRASLKYTFGFKRAEILAALLNAAILIAICLLLIHEAYARWQAPSAVDGTVMLVVSIIGLFVNLLSVWLLHRDKKSDINTRAAYLHLLGDTLSSVAVVLGALGMIFWDIYWLDPLITFLVSLYIIYHTWSVLRQATDILMQSAPTGLDVNSVVEALMRVEGVGDIHHMHIWSLSEDQVHFEAHLTAPNATTLEAVTQIRRACEVMLERYGIHHTILQIEAVGCPDSGRLILDHSSLS